MWQGTHAKAERDRFGGITITHKDGANAYIQPGDEADSLADTLDQCASNVRMSPEDNIDGLLCDYLEGQL
jgi:hypothetical protein